MDIKECIRTRKSVRTFEEVPLKDADLQVLKDYSQSITNPFSIPVSFVFLDAKEHCLSSPVLKGAQMYVAGKIAREEYSEVAFGYSFEDFVLYAWSLGIGTTWIAGTMNRTLFETAAKTQANERMYCMSPLGYPSAKRSLKEIAMRKGIQADKRKDSKELFFINDFATPLSYEEEERREALELVRLAPSATNSQPWRIVKKDNKYHFYPKGGYGNCPLSLYGFRKRKCHLR